MQFRELIFLAIMTAGITAGPVISEQREQCARTCIESKKFSYEVGKSYVYEYEAETSISPDDSEERNIKYLIRAVAEIESMSKCNFVLRLKSVSLESGFTISDEGRLSAAEMKSTLEKYVLPFAYQDGTIDHICPDSRDQTWAINIKRGVLTAFQNTMDNFDRDYVGHEIDIAGKCPVTYQVTDRNEDNVIISKYKQVDKCRDRIDIATSVKTSTDVDSLSLLKSTHDCLHKVKNGILQESLCKENYNLRPFPSKGKSATATARLSLRWKFQAPGTGFQKGDVSRRSSLTYEHSSHPVRNVGRQDAAVALSELCNATRDDVRPDVPRLFTRFVNQLRSLDYDEITAIYSKLDQICSATQNAKKLFFDATSMSGSSSAILLMNKLIEEKQISYLEAELWLMSLALIPKPTEKILDAAIGILDNYKLTRKALLGISSLGFSYCKIKPNCHEEPTIMKLSQKLRILMEPINSKHALSDESKDMVILVLKAIGNLGLVDPLVSSSLESINSDSSNIEIRLAGIEALRRVQCHQMPTDVMTRIFINMEEDVELRIAAYINLMKCPSKKIFSAIKHILEIEEVSQVGSFVWTHLTNIQESVDPLKKNITLIIRDEILFKKFSPDFRKFSRYYETSLYSESMRTGAHIEGNVIFTPKSYLPRSAKFDLDIDVFGNRIELLQLGGRMEGLEYVVESFFGPNGYFPDDTLREVMKSAREKKPYDEKKLNDLTKTFNRLNPTDDPRGSFYLRVFGNELHNAHFNGIQKFSGQAGSYSLQDVLLRLMENEETDITKAFTFLDSSITVPTMTGLPLKLKVNGTAAFNMKLGATFKYQDETLRMKGHFKPSAAVEITGSMTVDGMTSESGVVMVATGHTSTAIEGEFQLRRGHLISGRVNFPKDKLQILDIQTNFYTVGNGVVSESRDEGRDIIKSKSCFGHNLAKYTGMKFCGEMKYPFNANSAIDFISDPVSFKLAVLKTDPTLTSYDLEYRWHDIVDKSGAIPGPTGKIGKVSFNTPGSTIDREMTASFEWNYEKNSVYALVNTPLKKIAISAQFSNTDNRKGFQASMKLDGTEIFNVISEMQRDKRDSFVRITPRLLLKIRDKTLVDTTGYLQFENSNFKLDLGIHHLTTEPITLKGSVENVKTAGNSRNDAEFALSTPVLSLSTSGYYQLIGYSASTKFAINYKFLSHALKTIEFNAKFTDSSVSNIMKVSANAELSFTALPSAYWAIAWDIHKYRGYMENVLELSQGTYKKLTLKQLHQSEGNGSYARKTSGSIELQFPPQEIDFKIYYDHISNGILVETSTLIKYAPESEIQLKGSIHNSRDGKLMNKKIFLGAKYANAELNFVAKLQQPSVNQYIGEAKIEIWDGMWMQCVFAKNKTMSSGNAYDHHVQAKVIAYLDQTFEVSVDILSNTQNTTVVAEISFGKLSYSAQLEHQLNKTTRHMSAVVNTPKTTYKGYLDIRHDAAHTGAAIDLSYGDMYHMTADAFVKNEYQLNHGHVMLNLDVDNKPRDAFILDYVVKPTNEATEVLITVEYPKWKPLSIKYSLNEKNNSRNTWKRHLDIIIGNVRFAAATIELHMQTEAPKSHLGGVIQIDLPHFKFSPHLSFIHDTVHENTSSRWRNDLVINNGDHTLLKAVTSGTKSQNNGRKNLRGILEVNSPHFGKESIMLGFGRSSTLDKLNTDIKVVLPSGNIYLLNYGIDDISTDYEYILQGNLNISTPLESIRDISTSGKLIVGDGVSTQIDLLWNAIKISANIEGKLSSAKNKRSALVNSKFSTPLPGYEDLSSSWRLLLQPSSISTMGEIVWGNNNRIALEAAISGEKAISGGIGFVTSIHLVSPFNHLEDILLTSFLNSVDKQSRFSLDFKWAPERALALSLLKRINADGKMEAVISIDTSFSILKHAEAESIIEFSISQMLMRVGCQYNDIRATFGVNVNQSSKGLQLLTTFSSNIPNFETITAEFDCLHQEGDYSSNVALTVNDVRSKGGFQISFDKLGGFAATFMLNSPMHPNLNNVKFNLDHTRTDEILQLKSLFAIEDNVLMSLDAKYSDRDLTFGREADAYFAFKSLYRNIGPVKLNFKHQNRHGYYNPQATIEYQPGKTIKIKTEFSVGTQKGYGKILTKTPFPFLETSLQLTGHYDLTGTRKKCDLSIVLGEKQFIEIVVNGIVTGKKGDMRAIMRSPFHGIGVIAGELLYDVNIADNKTVRLAISQDSTSYEFVASVRKSQGGRKYEFQLKSPVKDLSVLNMSAAYDLSRPDKSFMASLVTVKGQMQVSGVVRLNQELMDSELTIRTTWKNWEFMKIKTKYDWRKPEKSVFVNLLIGNDIGLTLQSAILRNSGTFIANTTWLNSRRAEFSGNYSFGLESKTFEGSFKSGDLVAVMNSELVSLQDSTGCKISLKSTIPGFNEIIAYSSFRTIGFRKSLTAFVNKDDYNIKASGEFTADSNSFSASLSLKTPIPGIEIFNVNASHRLGYSMITAEVNDRYFDGILSYKLTPRTKQSMTTEDEVAINITIDKVKYDMMGSMLKTSKEIEINFSIKTPWKSLEKFGLKAVVEVILSGCSLLLQIDSNNKIYQFQGRGEIRNREYSINAHVQIPTPEQFSLAISSMLKFNKVLNDSVPIIWLNNTAILNLQRNEIIIRHHCGKELQVTFNLETFAVNAHIAAVTNRTNNTYILSVVSNFNENSANFTFKKFLDNISASLVGKSWYRDFSTFSLQSDFNKTDNYDLKILGTRNSKKFDLSGKLILKEEGFNGYIKSAAPIKGFRSLHINFENLENMRTKTITVGVKSNYDFVQFSGLLSCEDSRKSLEFNITDGGNNKIRVIGSSSSTPGAVRLHLSAWGVDVTMAPIAEITIVASIGYVKLATLELSAYSLDKASFSAEVLFNDRTAHINASYEIGDTVKNVNFNVLKDGSDILTVALKKMTTGNEDTAEHSQLLTFLLKMAPDVLCEANVVLSPGLVKSNILVRNFHVKYKKMNITNLIVSDKQSKAFRLGVDCDKGLTAAVTSEISTSTEDMVFATEISSNIKGLEVISIASVLEHTSVSTGVSLSGNYKGKRSSFSAGMLKFASTARTNVTFDSEFEILKPFRALAELNYVHDANAIFYVYVGDERKLDFHFNMTSRPEARGITISLESPLEAVKKCYILAQYDFSQQDKNCNLEANWNEKTIKGNWYAKVSEKMAESMLQLTFPNSENQLLSYLSRYDATQQMQKRVILFMQIGDLNLDMIGNVEFFKTGGATTSFQATTPFRGLEIVKMQGYHDVQKLGSPYELNVMANNNSLLNLSGTLRHNMPLYFDGTLSASSPMFSIENIGLKYGLQKKSPYHTGVAEFTWGNNKIKLNGNVTRHSINLELLTPFELVQRVAIIGSLNSRKDPLVANSTVSINDKIFSAGGELKIAHSKFIKFKLEIITPIAEYSRFTVACIVENKNPEEVKGFLRISMPYQSESDIQLSIKLTKIDGSATGSAEFLFGNYEMLTSYQNNENNRQWKAAIKTPHKGFNSITVDGFVKRGGDYRHQFQIGFETPHGRNSLDGTVNVDPRNIEVTFNFKCSAMRNNTPFSFLGQLNTSRKQYAFHSSIMAPFVSHRITGKLLPNGFQGFATMDPPVFTMRSIGLDWKITRDAKFSLDGNAEVVTDSGNSSIHVEVDTHYERIFGKIQTQFCAVGLGNFSSSVLLVKQNNNVSCTADIIVGTSVHSAQFNIGLKSIGFDASFSLNSPILPPKRVFVMIFYSNNGPNFMADFEYGAISRKITAGIMKTKAGSNTFSMSLESLPSGQKLEIYGNYSANDGKIFQMKLGITHDAKTHEGNIIVQNGINKSLGSLVMTSSYLGDGKLELKGSFARERQEKYDAALGLQFSNAAHGLKLSVNKGVKRSILTVQVKSPLLPESEITFSADLPKTFSTSNADIVLGMWTPSTNHSISGKTYFYSGVFKTNLNVSSTYAALNDVSFSWSVAKPWRILLKTEMFLSTPYFFNESFRFNGAVEKVDTGYNSQLDVSLPLYGTISTLLKFDINKWNPAVLQANIQTPMTNNSFQMTVNVETDRILSELLLESTFYFSRPVKIHIDLMKEKLHAFRVNLIVEFGGEKFELRNAFIISGLQNYILEVEAFTPWESEYSTRFVGNFRKNLTELMIGVELHRNDMMASFHSLILRGSRRGIEGTVSFNRNTSHDHYRDISATFGYLKDAPYAALWQLGIRKDGYTYKISRRTYRTEYSSYDNSVLEIGDRKFEMMTSYNSSTPGSAVEIQLFSYVKHQPEYSFHFLYDMINAPFVVKSDILFPDGNLWFVNGSMSKKNWHSLQGNVAFGRDGDWTRRIQFTHQNNEKSVVTSIVSTYNAQPEFNYEWESAKYLIGRQVYRLQITTPFKNIQSAAAHYTHDLLDNGYNVSSLIGNLNGRQLLNLTTTSKEFSRKIEILNPVSPITVFYTYYKKVDGISIRGNFTWDSRRPLETSATFVADLHYSAGREKNITIEITSVSRKIRILLKSDVARNGIVHQLNLKWGPNENDCVRCKVFISRQQGEDSKTFFAYLPSQTIKQTAIGYKYQRLLNVTFAWGLDSEKNKEISFQLKREINDTNDGISRNVLTSLHFPGLGKEISFMGSVNTSASQGLLQMHNELNYGTDIAISDLKIRRPVGLTGNYHFDITTRTQSGRIIINLYSYLKQIENSIEFVLGSSSKGINPQVQKRHCVLTLDKQNQKFESQYKYGQEVASVSGYILNNSIHCSVNFNDYRLSTSIHKVAGQRKIVMDIESFGDKKYYFTMGVENKTEIIMEVLKDSGTVKSSHFKFRFYLNQSRELVTRVTWVPEFIHELQEMCKQGWQNAKNFTRFIIVNQTNVLQDFESFGLFLLGDIKKDYIAVKIYLRTQFPVLAQFMDKQLMSFYNSIEQNAWYMKDVLSALDSISPKRYVQYVFQWTPATIRNLMRNIYATIEDTLNHFSCSDVLIGSVNYSAKLFVEITRVIGQCVISGALKISNYLIPTTLELLKSAEEWIIQAIVNVAGDFEEMQWVKSIKGIASGAYEYAMASITDFLRNTFDNDISEQFEKFQLAINNFSDYMCSVLDFLATDANLKFAVSRLLDLVNNFAVHTLRTAAVSAIPKVEVFDPAKGELTITQQLPIIWRSFDDIPTLGDIDYSTTVENFYQYVDESVKDIYYGYKFNLDYNNWIPPFKKQAIVVGGKRFITFDGRNYKFDGSCTYLLAKDFTDNNFTSVIKSQSNRKIIHVEFNDATLTFPLTEDLELLSRSLKHTETSIMMTGNVITAKNQRGVLITYDTKYDIFMIEISGWYFGKTGGLFGNSDNMYYNDLAMPSGELASSLEEFGQSWNVAESCEDMQTAEETYFQLPYASKICSAIFINSDSTVQPCYSKVDPMFFISMCVQDENPGNKSAICQAAVAYKMMCEAKGVSVKLPSDCRTCQYTDKIISAGKTIFIPNKTNVTSFDVMYVVEQGCQDKSLEVLDAIRFQMDSVYKVKYGKVNSNYFVIGYGGDEIAKKVPLGKSIVYGRDNVFDAINFATTQFVHPLAAKTIVLLPCSSCTQQAMFDTYGQILKELLTQYIKLHIIVPQKSSMKMPSRVKDLEILGFDKDSVSMERISDGKFVQGDADMRRQVAIPKDLCLTMSLETGGIVHRNVVQNYSDKSTLDWLFDRALTIDMPCEKCKCVESADEKLSTICEPCTPADQVAF